MNKLIINGKQNFMGIEIPRIEGGFGENQRCVLAKDIALIHDTELKEINQSLKRLIKKGRIKKDLHYIDLKGSVNYSDLQLDDEFIRKSANIFILSERGYCSLIKYMDDDKSWEVHERFIDEYFTMRQTLNNLTEEQKLQLAIIQADTKDDVIIASSNLDRYRREQLKDKDNLLLIAGEKTSLLDDFLIKPDTYSIDNFARALGIKELGVNNLHKYLRENKIMMTDKYSYTDSKGRDKTGYGIKHFTIYSYYIEQGYFKHNLVNYYYGGKISETKQNKAILTGIGVQWLYKKLQKDGYIPKKDLDTIIKELGQAS